MDKGNTSCMTYCGFLGLWCGDKHAAVSSRTSAYFEIKLAFCGNFDFFCQFLAFLIRFLRTKVELVDRCRKQEKVLGGKTKFWMAFRGVFWDKG